MLWLGGFLALEVTTSTPDAFCPTLEDARAAIRARVGEVEGAYRAEFALIRSSDGRQSLDLVVRKAEVEVLHRELPLDEAGCQDAAQALALVLERYFDAIENPPPPGASASTEPAPVVADNPPLPMPSQPRPDLAAPRAAREPAVRARAGVAYDFELGMAPTLGVELLPSSLRLTKALRWGLGLDVASFVALARERVREQEITEYTAQGALSLPVLLGFERWSVAIGPWAQLRLQRARGVTLEHEQPAYRTLPGVGGFARVGWSLAPTWTLGAGVAAGGQLTSAAARFVLRGPEATRNEVLIPRAGFAQAHLTLALSL